MLVHCWCIAGALLSFSFCFVVVFGTLEQVQRLKFSSRNRAHTRAELEEVDAG
jgi:hypothetical protein